MMFWNKIKIVTVMACMIALVGTGSRWLARSQSGAETSLSAAAPQGKKELPEAVPDLAERTKTEIKRIHAQMDYLAEKEAKEEEELTRESLEARLDLAAAQDDLRLREQENDLDRERERGRIKAAEREVVFREKGVREFEAKMDKDRMGKAFEEGSNRLTKAVMSAESVYGEVKQRFLVQEVRRAQELRSIRKRVFQVESKIRHIEVVQARKREEIMSRRQALLARLHQLEDKALDLQPADRLRDVERKLDTLRREVGELRRALERQENDPRKKP